MKFDLIALQLGRIWAITAHFIEQISVASLQAARRDFQELIQGAAFVCCKVAGTDLVITLGTSALGYPGIDALSVPGYFFCLSEPGKPAFLLAMVIGSNQEPNDLEAAKFMATLSNYPRPGHEMSQANTETVSFNAWALSTQFRPCVVCAELREFQADAKIVTDTVGIFGAAMLLESTS